MKAPVMNIDPLEGYSTKELLEELVRREGVA